MNLLNPVIYGHADCDHSRHDACDHSPHHGDDHDGCVMTNCDVLHAACDAKSSLHLDRTRHTMPHTCTVLQNCRENTQHTKPSLKRTRNTFYQYHTAHTHHTIHTIPHVCIVFHHRYLHTSQHHYWRIFTAVLSNWRTLPFKIVIYCIHTGSARKFKLGMHLNEAWHWKINVIKYFISSRMYKINIYFCSYYLFICTINKSDKYLKYSILLEVCFVLNYCFL